MKTRIQSRTEHELMHAEYPISQHKENVVLTTALRHTITLMLFLLEIENKNDQIFGSVNKSTRNHNLIILEQVNWQMHHQ